MPNVYSLIIGEFTWTSLLPTLSPTVVADEPSGSPDSGMPAQRDDVTDRQVTSAANEAILDKESELKESEIADTAFAHLRECYLTEYEDKSMDDDAVYVAMEASSRQSTAWQNPPAVLLPSRRRWPLPLYTS